jgi:coproporphyrinogen III oxidase
MFELTVAGRPVWWFGGGADLTPSVVVDADARHFHSVLRQASDAADPSAGGNATADGRGAAAPVGAHGQLFPRFKTWADEYFRIKHRDNECRGIGGMFFDDLDPVATGGMSQEQLFRYVSGCGDAFCAAYFPVVRAHVAESFTEQERRFQQLRRGRYVEFNVMYDRGTKFGLQMPSSAEVKTESILMSLPLTARYEYKYQPQGSEETRTQDILRNPVEWV